MNDIRLNTGYFRHPKTVKMIRTHGSECVLAHLKLLLWAAENRSTGRLDGLDIEDLVIITQSDDAFIKYMIDIKLIDISRAGVMQIHDWVEWNPYVAGKAKRQARARKAAEKRWNRFIDDEIGEISEIQDRDKTNTNSEIENPQRNQTLTKSGDASSNASSNAKSMLNRNSCDAYSNAKSKKCDHAKTPSIQFEIQDRDKTNTNSEIENPQRNQTLTKSGDASSNAKSMLNRNSCDALFVSLPKESSNDDSYIRARGGGQEIPPPENSLPENGECPFKTIVDLYHATCTELPPLKSMGKEFKKNLNARWKSAKEKRSLDWWKKYFTRVANSDFLNGRTGGGWTATLPWLVRPTKMENVLAGEYDNRGNSKEVLMSGRGRKPNQDELETQETKNEMKDQLRRRKMIRR